MPNPRTGVCINCGKPSRRERQYCTRECYVDSRWTVVPCGRCGKEFRKRKIYIARNEHHYCSQECASLAARVHPVEELDGKTYYLSIGGYYCAHDGTRRNRAVWEKHHGAIPPGFIVHHKNEIKTDDRIENLELKEWGEHSSEHHRKPRSETHGIFTCRGCDRPVERLLREMRCGQDRFCSKACSNRNRARNPDGSYASGHIR